LGYFVFIASRFMIFLMTDVTLIRFEFSDIDNMTIVLSRVPGYIQ
jgi:hypothetical protein